uniref:DEAD-box ATP-dependent RNA helicase 21 n=1 Tax=Tanacetum cinerariifolium TaxID=118510 RepID=A0A6L2NMY8_TANCI|nr:DEAD-box ATP-dependent RNA helicase 21 [Tanacetum cinerariifolium]
MMRSIDYVSNTILHANKKPTLGSSATPRERHHAMRDRVREEKTTPREQRHARRDKVREAENNLRKKDTIINQKHAKKREREVEVESIKEVQSFRTTGSGVESSLNNKLLKATPSPIQMAAIPLGSQHRDVIGVAETGSDKAGSPRSPTSSSSTFMFSHRRKNPFNHGFIHNFKGVLFSKTPRSQNDFCAFVKPEIYSQYNSSKYYEYAFSLNFSKKSYETETSVDGSDLDLERCETNPVVHSSKWAAAPDLH